MDVIGILSMPSVLELQKERTRQDDMGKSEGNITTCESVRRHGIFRVSPKSSDTSINIVLLSV